MLLDLTPYTNPLTRTPAVLKAVVEGRPDSWLNAQHAEDVMSPRRAVAHLVLTEREDGWIPKVKYILDPSSPAPSDSGITSTDLLKVRSVGELLYDFEMARAKNLRELKGMGITTGDLDKSVEDEELGTLTLQSLLACWVAHDLYHLGQMFKSYASLYREDIGPWQVFLNLPHFN